MSRRKPLFPNQPITQKGDLPSTQVIEVIQRLIDLQEEAGIGESNTLGYFDDSGTPLGVPEFTTLRFRPLNFTVAPGEITYIRIPEWEDVPPFYATGIGFSIHKTPVRASTTSIEQGQIWWTFGDPFGSGSGTIGFECGYRSSWWGSVVLGGGTTQTVTADLATATTNINGAATTADRVYFASVHTATEGYMIAVKNTSVSNDFMILLPLEVLYRD